MFFLNQKLYILLTSTSLLLGLSLPVLAQQIWSGTGRIVSGAGEGGIVELQLKMIGDRVQFLSGPSKDKTPLLLDCSNRPTCTAQTKAGTWQFVQTENELGVSLSQKHPYRIIRYCLSTQSRSNTSDRSLNWETSDLVNPCKI